MGLAELAFVPLMNPDSRVIRSLETLASWLKTHAPALGMPLAGPVAATEVARAEQLLRAPLPADYLTFLNRHDGQRLVPFVLIFGSSELLCLDLDPLPGGTPGQVIWISMKDGRRRVVASSFAVLLERLTEALRSVETVVQEEVELPEHLFDQLVGSG